MSISKELFIEVIEDVKRADNYRSKLNAFFSSNGVDGYIFQPDCATSVTKLLHSIFIDADEYDIIADFCFKYKFGDKWTVDDTSKFGYDLSNSELLYDYLTRGDTN